MKALTLSVKSLSEINVVLRAVRVAVIVSVRSMRWKLEEMIRCSYVSTGDWLGASLISTHTAYQTLIKSACACVRMHGGTHT